MGGVGGAATAIGAYIGLTKLMSSKAGALALETALMSPNAVEAAGNLIAQSGRSYLTRQMESLQPTGSFSKE